MRLSALPLMLLRPWVAETPQTLLRFGEHKVIFFNLKMPCHMPVWRGISFPCPGPCDPPRVPR